MPRDLFPERDGALDSLPKLEKTAKSSAPGPGHDMNSSASVSASASAAKSNHGSKDKIERDMDKQDNWSEIKPYTKSLTRSDVDACTELENATFPPQERATKEKVRNSVEHYDHAALLFHLCILP